MPILFPPERKPYVEGVDISFNVSSSGGIGLIAVSRDVEVGVDVEEVRDVPCMHLCAAEVMTIEEWRTWVVSPGPAQGHRLLSLWTTKEACMKALGLGVRLEPSTFAVPPSGSCTTVRIVVPTGGNVPGQSRSLRQAHVDIQVAPVDCGTNAVAAVAWTERT